MEDKTVILITIDALRPDHLNSYGYYRKTSPNLDKFTEQGAIFLNAIANGPETPSSFSAIFTSLSPYLEGGYSPLPSQKITFPEILKENNIFTYGIHSNPHLGRFFNYDRGFDIFLDGERYITREDKPQKLNIKELVSFSAKRILNYKDFIRKLIYHLKGFNKIKYWLRKKIPILTDILLPFTPMAYNAPYIVNKLISFLNEFKGSLFLWVHFMDVHSPFNPPSENLLKFRKLDIPLNLRDFYNKELRLHHKKYKITPEMLNDILDLYDGSINFLDDSLIKFFKVIIQKLKHKCLVIITADHGESFYEHNTLGHQGNIFEEVLKVPLFIIEIGKKFSLNRVNETVQLIDIPSTILDYFGIDIPKNFQGKSLLPIIKGISLLKERLIISECYQRDGKIKRNNKEGFKLISIRTENWKYVFDEEKNLEYLFNLNSDPKEKYNLITENVAKLDEFREIKDLHDQNIMDSYEKSKISMGIKKIDFGKLK